MEQLYALLGYLFYKNTAYFGESNSEHRPFRLIQRGRNSQQAKVYCWFLLIAHDLISHLQTDYVTFENVPQYTGSYMWPLYLDL